MIFSGAPAKETSHFLARITREVPGVEISGVLCECPQQQQAAASLRDSTRAVGHALLRFAQASSVKPASPRAPGDADLVEECRRRGIGVRFTHDLESAESLELVRSSRADLGAALTLRATSAAVLRMPRFGSICGLRCSSAAGAVEPRVLVAVCRTTDRPDAVRTARSRGLRIDLFDTAVSLGLKSALLGEDLLVEVLRDFTRSGSLGSENEPSTAAEPALRNTAPPNSARRHYRAPRTRAAWKLALRSTAYLGLLPVRNWVRRLRKRFPLVILFHHLVSDRPHPMGISTEGFLQQLRYLKRHYRLVGLEEGLRLLASGSIDQPTAVLTFDDGYADNFVAMRAVLRVEPAPVTMFICSGLVQEGQPFPHDARDHREGFAPLSPAEVQRMAAEGITIGSHTRTHFNCGSTDAARLESEIAGSRRDLEALLGRSVPLFSFPWGKPANMSAPAVAMARASYEHYFSAYGGVNFPGMAHAHLLRTAHPHSLWELELTLQQFLEFKPAGYSETAQSAGQPGSALAASGTSEPGGGLGSALHSR